MSFFQNPFNSDFEGNWLLGDRHYIPKFVIPGNKGRGEDSVYIYPEGTYNLSGNDLDGNPKNVLNIVFALHDFKNWSTLPVTIVANSLAATTVEEIVSSLNNSEIFNSFFTVSYKNSYQANTEKVKASVVIKQKHPVYTMKFYVKNGQAESVLLFNKLATVREIPSFFSRHTMANRHNFEDSVNMLVELNTASDVDSQVISRFGLNPSIVKEDYELLGGKSGLFIFTKQEFDETNLVSKIEYHAGAKVGDLAKKTTYADFTGSIPGTITEVPYVLQEGDLVTP